MLHSHEIDDIDKSPQRSWTDEEDELAANVYISESNFKFEDFVKRLVHPKVIKACGLALKKFEKNTTFTNHCIVKLLHRVAVDCRMPAMIFQLSIFQSFEKILEMDDLPQLKELQTFSKFVVRQFIKVAQKNEHVYIECLFWKNKTIAYEVEEGYGSLQNEKKTLNIWDEPSEDELRRLFMEHQEQQMEQDVVDYVWQNIIDSSKTRRAVLKKLKDMYLLTDEYKGPKKVGTGRNRPWDEAEEEQLQELYERYKDDADPLGCIISGLERDRPKNRIIEKMLVMGLIEDKKQLRKKRAKKSNKSSNGGSDLEMSDQDGDLLDSDLDDSEDEDMSNPSTSTHIVQRTTQTKPKKHTPRNRTNIPAKSKKSKTPRSSSIPRQDLSKMLIQLVDLGMSDALQWIRDSFGDALEDLEAEDNEDCGQDEGVPLVPLMEHSITAMDNETFLTTLRAMHVHEPVDEQENFWRISSGLSVSKLRGYCEIIKQAIDKTLLVEETSTGVAVAESEDSLDTNTLQQMHENVRSDSNADVADLMFKNKSQDSNNEDASNNINPLSPGKDSKKTTTKTRIQLMDDSDDETNNSEADISSAKSSRRCENNEEESTHSSRKRISSSESENELTQENVLKNRSTKKIPPKSKSFRNKSINIDSDSDDSLDKPGISTNGITIENSDESDNENQSKTKIRQSAHLTDSDSDSNDALDQNCEELFEDLIEVVGFSQNIIQTNHPQTSQAHNKDGKRIRRNSGSNDDSPIPKKSRSMKRVIESDDED